MRILLTGHSGYIGSVMAPILKREGFEVVGLDTGYFEECLFEPEINNISSIKKDIRDITIANLQGYDAVIHLANLSNDPLGSLKPELTYEINHQASVQLARLAKDAGVQRFLFASSCSMYGAANSDEILDENSPLRPVTPYAISKVRSEEDISKLSNDHFSPVFMRNATAYGVSPRLRIDIVLNNLVGWAYITGKIRILSDGTPWRPIVHIEDISRAFLAALIAPRPIIHNQAFNIGANGENYQVREMAEIVREVVPDCSVEYAGQVEVDQRNYRVDFSKLEKTLTGFKPRWNARLGAQQLYEAYKNNNLTQKDFEGRKFIRLNQIRHLLAFGQLQDDLRWKHLSEVHG